MKRKLAILIIVLGSIVLLIGCGLTLFDTSSNKNEDVDKANSNNDKTSEKVDEETKEEEIKDYSEYLNYELNITSSITTNGNTNVSEDNATIDLRNGIILTDISSLGVSEKVYFDVTNHYQYASADEKNWTKASNDKVIIPSYDSLIAKVKKLDGVTVNANGEYQFISNITQNKALLQNIPITVRFDDNGFLSLIIFDLSTVYPTNDQFIVKYLFSNINKVGDIKIPTEVESAVVSNENTAIYFYSLAS